MGCKVDVHVHFCGFMVLFWLVLGAGGLLSGGCLVGLVAWVRCFLLVRLSGFGRDEAYWAGGFRVGWIAFWRGSFVFASDMFRLVCMWVRDMTVLGLRV